jgi:hypothetical protein
MPPKKHPLNFRVEANSFYASRYAATTSRDSILALNAVANLTPVGEWARNPSQLFTGNVLMPRVELGIRNSAGNHNYRSELEDIFDDPANGLNEDQREAALGLIRATEVRLPKMSSRIQAQDASFYGDWYRQLTSRELIATLNKLANLTPVGEWAHNPSQLFTGNVLNQTVAEDVKKLANNRHHRGELDRIFNAPNNGLNEQQRAAPFSDLAPPRGTDLPLPLHFSDPHTRQSGLLSSSWHTGEPGPPSSQAGSSSAQNQSSTSDRSSLKRPLENGERFDERLRQRLRQEGQDDSLSGISSASGYNERREMQRRITKTVRAVTAALGHSGEFLTVEQVDAMRSDLGSYSRFDIQKELNVPQIPLTTSDFIKKSILGWDQSQTHPSTVESLPSTSAAPLGDRSAEPPSLASQLSQEERPSFVASRLSASERIAAEALTGLSSFNKFMPSVRPPAPSYATAGFQPLAGYDDGLNEALRRALNPSRASVTSPPPQESATHGVAPRGGDNTYDSGTRPPAWDFHRSASDPQGRPPGGASR